MLHILKDIHDSCQTAHSLKGAVGPCKLVLVAQKWELEKPHPHSLEKGVPVVLLCNCFIQDYFGFALLS